MFVILTGKRKVTNLLCGLGSCQTYRGTKGLNCKVMIWGHAFWSYTAVSVDVNRVGWSDCRLMWQEMIIVTCSWFIIIHFCYISLNSNANQWRSFNDAYCTLSVSHFHFAINSSPRRWIRLAHRSLHCMTILQRTWPFHRSPWQPDSMSAQIKGDRPWRKVIDHRRYYSCSLDRVLSTDGRDSSQVDNVTECYIMSWQVKKDLWCLMKDDYDVIIKDCNDVIKDCNDVTKDDIGVVIRMMLAFIQRRAIMYSS